jgi:predicted enzyme related to lactoylglutathione lyase
MDAVFNFIGMSVADWPRAYKFFTQTLGWSADLNPAYSDWASWHVASDNQIKSLICELFDGGQPVARRWWGHQQNLRPAIHVSDLAAVAADLQVRGMNFTSDLEAKPWGRQIEFETVEGIRWALAQIPNKPVRADFTRPHIGYVALKVYDFEAQKRFYETGFGLTLADSSHDYARFTQRQADYPFIVLEPGGELIKHESNEAQHTERTQPFLISFMTMDVQAAAQQCRDLGVAIVRPVTKHEDWRGTDLIIADVDGNSIQVVQYWS